MTGKMWEYKTEFMIFGRKGGVDGEGQGMHKV